MALALAVAGATRPGQSITWLDGDGAPVDLTGATITGKKRNRNSGTVSNIVGLLTVTSAANGVFVWTYDLADVDTAGLYVVQFTASFGSAALERTIITDWAVREAL